MGDKAEGDHDPYIRNNSQLQVQEQLHKQDAAKEVKAVVPAEPGTRGGSILPRLFRWGLFYGTERNGTE